MSVGPCSGYTPRRFTHSPTGCEVVCGRELVTHLTGLPTAVNRRTPAVSTEGHLHSRPPARSIDGTVFGRNKLNLLQKVVVLHPHKALT